MGVLWLAVIVATLVGAVHTVGWARTRRIPVEPHIDYRANAFDQLVGEELGAPNVLPSEALQQLGETRRPLKSQEFQFRDLNVNTTVPATPAWAVAADMAMPSALLWERWSALDEHVFAAFEHLTHAELDSAADLSRLIDAEGYKIKTAAFQRMLKGHVAEAYASEHAAEAGHHVEMPEASNYPGTDAWLDGHAVNVKAVADVGSLGHHFERYPDVPVIVPIDAENIPDDALHFDPRHAIDFDQLGGADPVIVDDALANADVADQVGDAMSAIDQPAADLGVPWVTVAISSLREGRLLLTGGTDVVRAAQNVAVDGLGVGGGALVGAKAGALAGSVFGPVGAALGSVVGGVVGGMKGRKIAAEIRRQPLVDAIAGVKRAQDAYQSAASDVSGDVSARWIAERRAEEEKLRESAIRDRRDHDAAVSRIRNELFSAMVPDAAESRSMLDDAENTVRTIVTRTSAQLVDAAIDRPRRWFPRVFAPAEFAALHARKREATQWRARAQVLRSSPPATPVEARELFNVLLAVPGSRDRVRERIRTVQALRIRGMTTLAARSTAAYKRMVELRSAASARLAKRWETLQRDANERLAPRIEALKSAIAKCEEERRRAGLK